MHYKYTLIITIFFLCFIELHSQSSLADTIKIDRLIDSLWEVPTSEKSFKNFQEILAISESINYEYGKRIALNNIGLYYLQKSDFINAIATYQKLVSHSQATKNDEYLFEAYIGLSRANVFLELKHEADEYLKKAEQLTNKITDLSDLAYAYSDLGLYHVENENYHLGIDFLKKSKLLSQKSDSTNYFLITNFNLGIAYVETGQYNLAASYFNEYLNYAKLEKDSLSFGIAYGHLGSAYLKMSLFDKAFIYLDSSFHYSKLYNQIDNIYYNYEDISDAYLEKKNYKNALDYFKKYHNLKDSIVNFRAKQDVNEMRVKFEVEKKENELLASKNEVYQLESEKRKIWLLVGGLLAVVAILSLVFINAKRKQELLKVEEKLILERLKNKELQADQLQNELDNKEKDLTTLAIDIARKNEFSTDFANQLENLTQAQGAIKKSDVELIIRSFHNHLRINEDLSLLHKNINEINQAFYKKLDTNFKNLSANDKNVLGLIRLNLSNKDIASIKGISASSAKVSRYRLRKKLQLTPQVDIVKFLQEF